MKVIRPTGMDVATGQAAIGDANTLMALAGVVGVGTAPTVTLASGAGTGAAVSLTGGNHAGKIVLTSGMLGLAVGKILTLTFGDGLTYPNSCVCTFSAMDANFAGVLSRLYAVGRPDGVDLYITSLALSIATVYTGQYVIQGW